MERFVQPKAPALEKYTVVKGDIRLSVLSRRILRVERAEDGQFEDRRSQTVVCRDFSRPGFSCTYKNGIFHLVTREAVFEVSAKSLRTRVQLNGVWREPAKGKNLGGTARTLDRTVGDSVLGGGKLKIEDGIFSDCGAVELDDSGSLLLSEDGSMAPRKDGSVDKYVLAFGDDYLGGLREFYALTGTTPLIPKYALGNWWSRYYAYKQDEYLALMDKFAENDIPFTVATIDMDWHLVENVPKDVAKGLKSIVRGWTGYTFEKEYFPDYRQFFRDLKARGLAITMNLHPRDGIRYFEEQYPAMARANGVGPESKLPVEFDFTNRIFIESYFDLVLHPYEEAGVDFWWIDWQQGTRSRMPGLDPLWLLNHYHTLDAGRDGRTPLILSRYSGLGSHRYPLGFSGDTVVNWKSLQYQPRFTATASNAGYTWWSHDIGGHMGSRGEPELYIRWLQLGVFSPINRLHSSKDKWSKEPWLYGEEAERIAGSFLRLRHRLLPYLYTASVLTHTEGVPIVMPMYYLEKCPHAYETPDQFFFGKDVLVAPVLVKRDSDGFARTPVWLPEGTWTHLFTNERFEGGRDYCVETPLDEMPVFVRAGGIIPMLPERHGNSQEFDALHVLVFPGEGSYRMYDEVGYIDFAVREEDGCAVVSVAPSEDCVTKELTVELRGENVQIKTVPCGKTELRFTL